MYKAPFQGLCTFKGNPGLKLCEFSFNIALLKIVQVTNHLPTFNCL